LPFFDFDFSFCALRQRFYHLISAIFYNSSGFGEPAGHHRAVAARARRHTGTGGHSRTAFGGARGWSHGHEPRTTTTTTIIVVV